MQGSTYVTCMLQHKRAASVAPRHTTHANGPLQCITSSTESLYAAATSTLLARRPGTHPMPSKHYTCLHTAVRCSTSNSLYAAVYVHQQRVSLTRCSTSTLPARHPGTHTPQQVTITMRHCVTDSLYAATQARCQRGAQARTPCQVLPINMALALHVDDLWLVRVVR
eukprot:scaffold188054_cov17-Tisochrysis_lutea.AAC.1